MASDIVGGDRQALQDFLAPKLREIKGKLEAIHARLDELQYSQPVPARLAAPRSTLLLKQQTLEALLGNIETQMSSGMVVTVPRKVAGAKKAEKPQGSGKVN